MCNMWSVSGKNIYTKCQASSTISHIHNLSIAHRLLIVFINGSVVQSNVMVDGGSIPTEIQPHHMLDELFPLLLMILVEIHCSIKCTCHILKGKNKHNLHTFNLTCNWMHCAIRNGFRKDQNHSNTIIVCKSGPTFLIKICYTTLFMYLNQREPVSKPTRTSEMGRK